MTSQILATTVAGRSSPRTTSRLHPLRTARSCRSTRSHCTALQRLMADASAPAFPPTSLRQWSAIPARRCSCCRRGPAAVIQFANPVKHGRSHHHRYADEHRKHCDPGVDGSARRETAEWPGTRYARRPLPERIEADRHVDLERPCCQFWLLLPFPAVQTFHNGDISAVPAHRDHQHVRQRGSSLQSVNRYELVIDERDRIRDQNAHLPIQRHGWPSGHADLQGRKRIEYRMGVQYRCDFAGPVHDRRIGEQL